MEDLIKEMQVKVLRELTPARRRNDSFDQKQSIQRQKIAYVWFNWIQELFCDAVGFTIGGPAFVKAFSSYMNTLTVSDFRRSITALAVSSHPISWLRVSFLTRMARSEGFTELANQVEREWRQTAQMLNIDEDYFGFYHTSLEIAIAKTVQDMLMEASPRKFEVADLDPLSENDSFTSPVKLLNSAWHVYETNPEKYVEWENTQIVKYIGIAN
jgi:hypothetical protein